MWIFSDFGLLMPSLVPERIKDRESVKKWTNNGEYELQVRARLREHLEYFMETYMEPGTYNPEIHATPSMDYNYRFYTTREAFAVGIGNIALNMDYEKFKETSTRFSWNNKYHSLLTRIWGTLCELNQPGGIWGPKTKDNPKGYSPAWKYGSSRGTTLGDRFAESHYDYEDTGRRIGDSFGERLDDYYEDDGWMDDSDEKAMALIDELDSLNVPEGDWCNYTSPAELTKIVSFLKKTGSRSSVKKIMRGARKNRSKALPTRRGW